MKVRHVELKKVPREIHCLCGLLVSKQHGYVSLELVPGQVDLPKIDALK